METNKNNLRTDISSEAQALLIQKVNSTLLDIINTATCIQKKSRRRTLYCSDILDSYKYHGFDGALPFPSHSDKSNKDIEFNNSNDTEFNKYKYIDVASEINCIPANVPTKKYSISLYHPNIQNNYTSKQDDIHTNLLDQQKTIDSICKEINTIYKGNDSNLFNYVCTHLSKNPNAAIASKSILQTISSEIIIQLRHETQLTTRLLRNLVFMIYSILQNPSFDYNSYMHIPLPALFSILFSHHISDNIILLYNTLNMTAEVLYSIYRQSSLINKKLAERIISTIKEQWCYLINSPFKLYSLLRCFRLFQYPLLREVLNDQFSQRFLPKGELKQYVDISEIHEELHYLLLLILSNSDVFQLSNDLQKSIWDLYCAIEQNSKT